MKNKRQRMRKFLAISLVVTILAVVTVFIVISFVPSLTKEARAYEEEPPPACQEGDVKSVEHRETRTYSRCTGKEQDEYGNWWKNFEVTVEHWLITDTYVCRDGAWEHELRIAMIEESNTYTISIAEI